MSLQNIEDAIGDVEALLEHRHILDDDHSTERLGEVLRLLRADRDTRNQPTGPGSIERIAIALERAVALMEAPK